MSYINAQIWKIIRTGNRNEEEERAFKTPGVLDDSLAEAAGITQRGSRGSKEEEERGGAKH